MYGPPAIFRPTVRLRALGVRVRHQRAAQFLPPVFQRTDHEVVAGTGTRSGIARGAQDVGQVPDDVRRRLLEPGAVVVVEAKSRTGPVREIECGPPERHPAAEAWPLRAADQRAAGQGAGPELGGMQGERQLQLGVHGAVPLAVPAPEPALEQDHRSFVPVVEKQRAQPVELVLDPRRGLGQLHAVRGAQDICHFVAVLALPPLLAFHAGTQGRAGHRPHRVDAQQAADDGVRSTLRRPVPGQ